MENEIKEISVFNSLKPKYQAFILEYIIDFNGERAYKKIYNIKKGATARVNASKLLTKPNIKAALKEKVNELLQDKNELLLKMRRELDRLAHSDIKEYVDLDDNNTFIATNKSDTRPIESIKVKRTYRKGHGEDEDSVIEETEFKMYNKISAQHELANLLGVSAKLQLVNSEGNDLPISITINGVKP